jgi:hypothetical protein
MIIKKKIYSMDQFFQLYFKQIPPLPPYFYIDNIKFEIECFDCNQNGDIITEIKCIDISNVQEDISKYIKIGQHFILEEFSGYEFVWKFKNYDYVYNYLESDDYFFFANPNKFFDYQFSTHKNWKITIDTLEGEIPIKLMRNITTSRFRSAIDSPDKVFEFGIKVIKKHLKNFNIIAF